MPDPDSPTMPSVSPGDTLNEMSLTALTVPSSVRKDTLRLRTSSSGVAIRLSRTLGSSRAYATSTSALASTMKKAP